MSVFLLEFLEKNASPWVFQLLEDAHVLPDSWSLSSLKESNGWSTFTLHPSDTLSLLLLINIKNPCDIRPI
jgi:hypothetical protein